VRLLLDAHIAKATVVALRKRLPSAQVEHVAHWRAGAFLKASDQDILSACHEEARVLVTFDQRTIPGLLRQWAAEERAHSGVIFGDKNSVAPDRPGVVAAAICSLAREIGGVATLNMVRFLRRAKEP